MQTLRQYEIARCATVSENYGITRAEYMRHYPYGSRVELWVGYLERETREGNPITRYVEQSIRNTFPAEQADRQLFWFAHNVDLARSTVAYS
jgi:hypothetical protein